MNHSRKITKMFSLPDKIIGNSTLTVNYPVFDKAMGKGVEHD